MLNRTVVVAVGLATLTFLPRLHSQIGAPPPTSAGTDGWGRPIVPPAKDQKPAPAPAHDISGIWDPPNNVGNQVLGAYSMPEDGKPEHQLPYTKEGLAALKQTKPTNGVRSVLPAETNDPVIPCDPQGFPRADLHELRTTQIIETPQNVIILYQFNKAWRVIWTDGRELPKDPEPRWYGYSVGKWADDYTFVVETIGMDERTWVDRAGRPHSDELRVEERFHRVDHDHLELTVTINDPKMYTRPWNAMENFRMNLLQPTFDVHEFICSPSEFAEYNKLLGNSISERGNK
jgi:hypothetical protein